jgi:hypothetical protein
MAVGKQRAHEFPLKGHAWTPTYELCRTLPDGSRQVVGLYFTLAEAKTRAKALQRSREEWIVYDRLTQKFVVSDLQPDKKGLEMMDSDLCRIGTTPR